MVSRAASSSTIVPVACAPPRVTSRTGVPAVKLLKTTRSVSSGSTTVSPYTSTLIVFASSPPGENSRMPLAD